ncbi:hypothetical protein [Arthrobacter sp. IK3]|uniref:hypothetical protein n=1 Tax=Arthrobacter sp. IK3 TaxID=3448169 RepID=UPI003EDFCBC2
MKKLSAVLRSERGDLLVGALIGMLVVGIVIVASASFLLVAGKASIANSTNAARSIALNSVLAEELPRAGSYTTAPSQVPAGDLTVSIRREGDILHAAVPRSGRAEESCSGSAPDPADCVQAQLSVSGNGAAPKPAHEAVELTEGTGGAKYTFKAAEGAETLQYVFKTESGDKDSTLTFSAGDAKTTVDIPRDSSGWYYGRLQVKPGSTITVKTEGPATYEKDTFTVYEVTSGK